MESELVFIPDALKLVDAHEKGKNIKRCELCNASIIDIGFFWLDDLQVCEYCYRRAKNATHVHDIDLKGGEING